MQRHREGGGEYGITRQSKKTRQKEYFAARYRRGREAVNLLDAHISVRTSAEEQHPAVVTEEQLRLLDDNEIFHPITEYQKRKSLRRPVAVLEFNPLRRTFALFVTVLLQKRRSGDLFQEGKYHVAGGQLASLDDVQDALRRYYDLSRWIPELDGMVLSDNGTEKDVNVVRMGFLQFFSFLQFCLSCFRSLSSKTCKPPKFSIANGFDIGILPPHVQDSTKVERRLSSVTALAVPMTVLQGGKHTFIQGHVSILTMDPAAIAIKLPYVLSKEDQKFLVVIAGKQTTAQEIAGMKRFMCRVSVLRSLLLFYIEHNVLYKKLGVNLDSEALASVGHNFISLTCIERKLKKRRKLLTTNIQV